MEDEIIKLMTSCIVNTVNSVPEPLPLIKIENETVATLGNFSCVIGKPKAGKTFFISLIVSTLLRRNQEGEKISSPARVNRILHFDTEQGIGDSQKMAMRISKILNRDVTHEEYIVFRLRGLDPNMRLNLIQCAMDFYHDSKFIIIDGIIDLLTKGYNDEFQATYIINKLLNWTEEKKIHIITVIHENKDNRSAKGHLGSYITQKAESILSVRKETNKEISTVQCEFSRGKGFNQFSFSINDFGLPFVLDKSPSTFKTLNRDLPEMHAENFHKPLLNNIYYNLSEINRVELIDKIQDSLEKMNILLGKTKCRKWLDYYSEKKYIYQNYSRGPYLLSKEYKGQVNPYI